jgi:signal transduction histidine kinase
MPSFSGPRHSIISLLTLAVGCGISGVAALSVDTWESSQRQAQFERQIENLATALQRSLTRYTDVLAFLGDYYTIHHQQVTRQDFATLVERSLQTYPGIQALEWAPLVRQDQRLAFEQAIQAEGYPDFQITELSTHNRLSRAGDRPYYIPVTYLAPVLNNEAAFGFDLNSDATRAAALEPARDSGQIMATGRIRLVQEQRDQYGFLVVLPLYQTASTPTTLDLRREQFQGVLLGVFRISDVVEESLQDLSYDIDFVLYDQSATPAERFLGRYDVQNHGVTAIEAPFSADAHRQRSRLCSGATDCTRTITVGQRQWSVVFSPSDQYPIGTSYGAMLTLLISLMMTAGLVLFLHRLSAELEQTKTLSDLKLRFFSMASHELRTPLSTIMLSAESLQTNHDQLSECQKQTNIQRIHLTAKQMGQQITDLLTLTRAEAGKLEFKPEMFEVSAFCSQVIEKVQVGIRQPIVFTSDDHPVKAFWDKALIGSLLTNLLSNSAKYSDPSTSIQVILTRQDHRAMIQVGDRGIGIPKADQTYIREAFQRGGNVGEIAGTGLGLAVVNTCVEMHRGDWTINSVIGRGTTVTVSLPLE